jgi:glycosyltransferase involved in cell wall biosynthesis
LKVLFFQQPKGYFFGGVTNVTYSLPRALAKNANVTYYPYFTASKAYLQELSNTYRRLAVRDFDITHFCITPELSSGSYVLFKLATSTSKTILNIHGIIQYEQILYKLKTNWFWGNSYKGLASTLRYCKLANKVVTYSEFMKREIAKWYKILPEKISVIPNGVDVEKFSANKRSEILLEGDPAILYLGSLSNFKSPDVLISALPQLQSEFPDLKLHLVGPGDTEGLRTLARKKNVEKNVVFHGSVLPKETPNYYKAADFCVFPSRRDTAGITLLEAMASGSPIIASKRGGTPEIILNNINGILFDPDDQNSLSNAILLLYKDKRLRSTISLNALKTVEQYSWNNIAKKYITLYTDLLNF